ncbi:MAG TPA: hypothetical protein VGS21_06340, partial [Acidimicrobiales bacterium]|nr:hypothetical protein [Acidimicrobiales bacterium]
PPTWASDNGGDQDLGSDTPALLPNGMMFIVGKSHIAYLLKQSHLGGINAGLTEYQNFCGSDPRGGLAWQGNIVYVPCTNGITAARIGASPPSITPLWTTNTGACAPPIVAGGLVWAIGCPSGTLYGLDPSTGNQVVSENINGVDSDFPAVSVGDGLLMTPATNGQVIAFMGPAGPPPPPALPTIAIASMPNADGYWLASANGDVFPYGAAAAHGSAGGTHLNHPIVGITSTVDGQGYWLVASDGGIFTYGDAKYYGSTGGMHLNKPIVGMAATSDGKGYWLVASDGGIFTFGDAKFRGSMGGTPLTKPIVGMARGPGIGYWEVASDGGIFTFGNAHFYGSEGGTHLNSPIIGMGPTADGAGYWLAAGDGGIFTFGDAKFKGSLGGASPPPVAVGFAVGSTGTGYFIAENTGAVAPFGTP